jgi:Fe-S cluster biogenesis protein NfuA
MSLDLQRRVETALAEHARPALDMDGTRIEVLDVTDGIARLRLGGVCGNCPSSIMAAVMGLEELVRRHVPEVKTIEAVP